MNAIYETKGRAKEYSELACNLYTGCENRCLYCYAPSVLRRDRNTYHLDVRPRKGILKALERDAKKLADAGETRQVLLCFTCDPYTLADVEYKITRQAIQILHNQGLKVSILTKGGSKALRDIGLLGAGDSFGTTLTFYGNKQSLEWELNAALPVDRLHTINKFHERGIHTWVSLEPVINPGQTLELIRMSHSFVDEYKVGKLNYHPFAKTIDWKKFTYDVVELLEYYKCNYYLKADLQKFKTDWQDKFKKG